MAEYQYSTLSECMKEIIGTVIGKLEEDSNFKELLNEEVLSYTSFLTYRECVYIIDRYGFTRAMNEYIASNRHVDTLMEKDVVLFLLQKELSNV
jgi:RAB protein geranylgeranyltransferase component A